MICACGIERTDFCRAYPAMCARCNEDHIDALPRQKWPEGHSKTLCNSCWLADVLERTKCIGCGALTAEGVAVFGKAYSCNCARNHGPLFGRAA